MQFDQLKRRRELIMMLGGMEASSVACPFAVHAQRFNSPLLFCPPIAKLHIAQEKRERDGSKREHRERPERYKRGMYRLRLYLLADPGERPAAVLVRASFREPLRPSVDDGS
jgi:hypothetical protein